MTGQYLINNTWTLQMTTRLVRYTHELYVIACLQKLEIGTGDREQISLQCTFMASMPAFRKKLCLLYSSCNILSYLLQKEGFKKYVHFQ